MPAARINTEIRHGLEVDFEESVKQARLALAEIYSGKNLGLNVRTVSADTELDVSDAYVKVDLSSTITLAPANSWSTEDVKKTPLVIIQVVNGRTVTLQPNSTYSADTIDGSSTPIVLHGEISGTPLTVVLISDSLNWTIISYVSAGQGVSPFPQTGLDARTAASAGINTTETIIVGGSGTAAYIPANSLRAGSSFLARISGTVTSSGAATQTFRFRFGVNGTTADGVLMSVAIASGAAGTNRAFSLEMFFTIRTIGASATSAGALAFINFGTDGISTLTAQTVNGTTTAVDTTVDNYLEVTYVSSSTNTTATFQTATLEIVKL